MSMLPQDDGVNGQPRFGEAGHNLLGQVHVAVIRLDSKVDNVANELRHLRDEHKDDHADHEIRLRALEIRPHVPVADFQRLEQRPYVSPATVWKVIGAITAIASLAISIMKAS